MSRTFLFERRNHVPSSDLMQIKHGFYQELLAYCEERKGFNQRKELLHQRLSERIEQEPEVRIAYIRLQQGVRKGRIQPGKIPKANLVAPELMEEALSLEQTGSELIQRYQELTIRFKSECQMQEQELYKLFREQPSVQNALLLTNYEMYCSLNKSYSSKKSGKVWKMMMRSFAKTAPLSSFTSICRGPGTGEESRISFAQWILLHWYELWLLLPEVIRASRYKVDYREQEGTLLTEGSTGPQTAEPGLYSRTKRSYRLKTPAAAKIQPGSIVSLDELALIWNESIEAMTAKAVQLLRCGYLKHTIYRESEPLTLELFIETVSALRHGSSRIQSLAQHLEAIRLLSGQLEQTNEVPQRERLLEITRRHVNSCCELLRWEGKYPVNPFNEDSYAEVTGPSVEVEPFADPLAEWAEVLPIFDNRLKFRLYLEHQLHDTLPVPYTSLEPSLSRYAAEYEQHVALNRTCKGSVFENAPAVARLEELRDQYRMKLAAAASGEDIVLERADLASLEAGLQKLRIRQPAIAGFWLQRSGTGELVVNDQEQIVQLDQIKEGLLDVIHQIRQTCNELRPPLLMEMGIVEALKQLIQQEQIRSDYTVELQTEPDTIEMDDVQILAVYRIVQELLRNADKHAKASYIILSLESHSGRLYFYYKDNGKGLDLKELKDSFGHMGISGIQERVRSLDGEIKFVSAPDQGFEVRLVLPLTAGIEEGGYDDDSYITG